MKLGELLTDRPLSLELDGGTLNLTFNPRAIRLRREDAAMNTPEDVGKMFCGVVSSWDLQRDDGTPWPLTPEALFDHELADGSTQEGLPKEVFDLIMERIGGEVQAPLQKKTASPSIPS